MAYQVVMTNGDVLEHSAKGSNWKKHKYLRKVGNKYIYNSLQAGIDTTIEKRKLDKFDEEESAKHVVKIANLQGEKRTYEVQLQQVNDELRQLETKKALKEAALNRLNRQSKMKNVKERATLARDIQAVGFDVDRLTPKKEDLENKLKDVSNRLALEEASYTVARKASSDYGAVSAKAARAKSYASYQNKKK